MLCEWNSVIFQEENKELHQSTSTTNINVFVDRNDNFLIQWAAQAGRLCIEWLPKIICILPLGKNTTLKCISLFFDSNYSGIACTVGAKITVSNEWIRKYPTDFGMIIHELVHVIQDYRDNVQPKDFWLIEGIADYIRDIHFEPNLRSVDFCNFPNRHYTDGYSVTAAFLSWIELLKCPNIIHLLNSSLYCGQYEDELFVLWCESTLNDLWIEFIKYKQKGSK